MSKLDSSEQKEKCNRILRVIANVEELMEWYEYEQEEYDIEDKIYPVIKDFFVKMNVLYSGEDSILSNIIAGEKDYCDWCGKSSTLSNLPNGDKICQDCSDSFL